MDRPTLGLIQRFSDSTLLICNKGAATAHGRIFTPIVEAVYYDNIEKAIALTEYYLASDDKRLKIARAGYHQRCWRDHPANLKKSLDGAISVPRYEASG